MDPKSSAGEALRLPAARDLPPVDEHLVQPETREREQLIRGRKVIAMPALPPHADQHVAVPCS